jgi:hypothetical protein
MKNFFCGAIFCAFVCAQAAQKDDWNERLIQLRDNPKNKKHAAAFRYKRLDGTGGEKKAEKKFVAIKEPTPPESDNIRKSGSLK